MKLLPLLGLLVVFILLTAPVSFPTTKADLATGVFAAVAWFGSRGAPNIISILRHCQDNFETGRVAGVLPNTAVPCDIYTSKVILDHYLSFVAGTKLVHIERLTIAAVVFTKNTAKRWSHKRRLRANTASKQTQQILHSHNQPS
ncbi:hypothetical protein BDZ85DRAFT_254774, partial [Elsinoe ampelina]